MHFVSTYDEASALIEAHQRFFVSDCGCRVGKGSCARSRMDVCLHFDGGGNGSGLDKHEVTIAWVRELLEEARGMRLVARPFRDFQDASVVGGICFCCDDCCSYFLNHDESCDQGRMVEKTTGTDCIQCGVCEPACYFNARTMVKDCLTVDRTKCYGCGLCVDICPAGCIKMETR